MTTLKEKKFDQNRFSGFWEIETLETVYSCHKLVEAVIILETRDESRRTYLVLVNINIINNTDTDITDWLESEQFDAKMFTFKLFF